MKLIKKHVNFLASKYRLAAIVPIPFRTWIHSKHIAVMIAKELDVPVFLDALFWQKLPANRQGELLNNDQRRFNVDRKMDFTQSLPNGAVLLLDDYTGSGATINEAARAIRKKVNLKQEIVPFAIASVKWRLGQPGIV